MRNPVTRPVGWAGSTARFVHPGPGRSLGERPLDAGHRLDLALDVSLDGPVRAVADEARDALAQGDVLGEIAEADALDTAGDDITAGDDHTCGAPAR